MAVLLTIGLCVLAGGALTLAYGIPIKDFSFGNTLIIAGTVAACAGFILIGLALAVRQLRRIAEGVEALSMLPARDEAVATTPAAPTYPAPSAPPPWPQPEAAPVRTAEPEPEAPRPAPSLVPEPVMPPPPGTGRARRNLLFVSSRREREREREREHAAPEDPVPPGAYSELTPPAPAPAEPPAADPAPPPTVVKSGSVDGMAYSLYSDGSIEADLAEGRMRFASIAELRSHLESKS